MKQAFETHFRELAGALEALSNGRGMDAISEVVPIAARRLVESDGATFVLRDGDQCHYVSEDAVEPLWAGKRFPLECCVSGWVIEHGEPAVIKNIYADERVPQEAYRPTFVTSMTMVPLPAVEPIGAIGVYWATSQVASPREIALLRALAEATFLALSDRGEAQPVNKSRQLLN